MEEERLSAPGGGTALCRTLNFPPGDQARLRPVPVLPSLAAGAPRAQLHLEAGPWAPTPRGGMCRDLAHSTCPLSSPLSRAASAPAGIFWAAGTRASVRPTPAAHKGPPVSRSLGAEGPGLGRALWALTAWPGVPFLLPSSSPLPPSPSSLAQAPSVSRFPRLMADLAR